MRAQWIDDAGTPAGNLDADTLRANGVHYQAFADTAACQPALDALMRDRGYVTQDEIALRPDTPNLEAICAKFTGEHYHDEDEVRLVLEGEGTFDIRPAGQDADSSQTPAAPDRWMRVTVETGDLIVVPARRYHRFELTESKNIKCIRLFKDQSGWVPHYR